MFKDNISLTSCQSPYRFGRVWGRHAPTKVLQKLTKVEEVKSRMDKKFSRIENLWPRDGFFHAFRKRVRVLFCLLKFTAATER